MATIGELIAKIAAAAARSEMIKADIALWRRVTPAKNAADRTVKGLAHAREELKAAINAYDQGSGRVPTAEQVAAVLGYLEDQDAFGDIHAVLEHSPPDDVGAVRDWLKETAGLVAREEWALENFEAIAAHNRRVEEHGTFARPSSAINLAADRLAAFRERLAGRASEPHPTTAELVRFLEVFDILDAFAAEEKARRGSGPFDTRGPWPDPAAVKVVAWLRAMAACERGD
jgi:hypothetical protein